MNMGKALSIIARQAAREQMYHDDIDLFYGGGECHAIVVRGECRRARQARRQAKSVSGLSRRVFNLKLRERTTKQAITAAFDRILDRSWSH